MLLIWSDTIHTHIYIYICIYCTCICKRMGGCPQCPCRPSHFKVRLPPHWVAWQHGKYHFPGIFPHISECSKKIIFSPVFCDFSTPVFFSWEVPFWCLEFWIVLASSSSPCCRPLPGTSPRPPFCGFQMMNMKNRCHGMSWLQRVFCKWTVWYWSYLEPPSSQQKLVL